MIGPVRLASPLLLAPIAGYCDLAFRTVCRSWGGVGLACTDLLSPEGLLRGSATSLDLAKTDLSDKPVGMQLYGSDPETMAQGARWAVEHGATVVDINMGCPVDKVTKKDGGSALLTNLDRAVAIAKRVREELDRCPLDAEEWKTRLGDAGDSTTDIHDDPNAPERDHRAAFTNAESRLQNPLRSSSVPLTCKMRLCWHDADYDAGAACSPHLARMLADVGVAAVTVHGRTTQMRFTGEVKLDGIARVVESVGGRIPVIGNGDVKTPSDAERMLRVTGCNGVMIGRAALASPWIFRDVAGYLATGWELPEPTVQEKIATILRYFSLMREHRDDRYALWQINRRVSWFAKTLQTKLPDGRMESVKPLKEMVRGAKTAQVVLDAFERFAAGGLRGGQDEPALVESADLA